MSLILEALKKSEAHRRLGAAPDLDTPFAARRRRRSPLPFIAIAILLATGAGWWLLRTPQTPSKAAPVVAAPVMAAPAQKPPAQKPPTTPGADRIMASATPAPPSASASSLGATRERSEHPRESFIALVQPRTADTARNHTTAAAIADKPAVPASVPALAAKPPAVPAPAVAAPAVATPTIAAPVVATPVPGMKKPELPTVAGVKKPELPADAAPPAGVKKPELPPTATASAPPYYELPFSVRKDLPAIKLSMHVYAPEPAQRFIILNDSRMTEGDTQNDLALREIRPDGAVLEFRGQRFFFPRDGL